LGRTNQRTTDQSTTRTLSLSHRQSALTQSFSLSVHTCLYLFSSDLCVFLKSSSRFATSTIRVDSLLLRLFLFRGSPSFQGYQNEGRGLHSRSFMLLRKLLLVLVLTTILIFVPLILVLILVRRTDCTDQFSRYCTAALSTGSRGYSKHLRYDRDKTMRRPAK
jgi:hypothetical protein